jgi:hypothetical protein
MTRESGARGVRVEKRFKELDQVVFVLALVLNPFEKLSRFGDKAQIDVFKISTELIAVSALFDSFVLLAQKASPLFFSFSNA